MKPAGILALCGLALAGGSAALAQSVISAHSGVIHYLDGQVYLDDQLVESKFGNFPAVKENGQVRTEEGRAEVLLTPGVFLRLGEHSSFRLITDRLIDTRLELLSGSAVVEADDIPRDNSVTLVCHDAAAHFAKKGLYRFDVASGEMRVFDGEADVTAGDKTVEVGSGHSMALDTLGINKFDKTATDALDNWSSRRAEYVSMANVQAANSLRASSDLYSGGYSSGWYFNPYFGMFTFVPGLSGTWYSPYGYRFFSPFDVSQAYLPGYYYFPTYGVYNTAYNSGAGRSSVPATAFTGISRTVSPASPGSPGRPSGGFGSGRSGFGGSVSHGGASSGSGSHR